MPADIYLNIDGIEGESTDNMFAKQMEIQAYTFGMRQATTSTVSSAGSMAGQKVSIDELGVTKYLDKASPKLMDACASAKHFKAATLSLRRALKGKQEVYMQYKLSDVIISSVHDAGSGEGGVPTEQIGISFAKIEWQYTVTTDAGGKGGQVSAGWDLATNQPV